MSLQPSRKRIWFYRSKYSLAADYIEQTCFRPDRDIDTHFVSLTRDGLLTVKHGFPFDGPSGPAWDTLPSMRGACLHDALYGLIREGQLFESDREAADNELRRIFLEDGMPPEEAESAWRAVRDYGQGAADPHRAVAPICAPG